MVNFDTTVRQMTEMYQRKNRLGLGFNTKICIEIKLDILRCFVPSLVPAFFTVAYVTEGIGIVKSGNLYSKLRRNGVHQSFCQHVWSIECAIHHERDVREEQHHTYMWHEQAITQWSWRMISIVACYHSAKLCAHAARALRSQHGSKKGEKFAPYTKKHYGFFKW